MGAAALPTRALIAFVALTLMTLAAGAYAASEESSVQLGYDSEFLDSDTPAIPAAGTDANAVNAWGLAFNPTAFAWVAANGAGKAVLFDGNGKAQQLVVTVPGVGGQPGTPTGIVFSGAGEDFVVTQGAAMGAAQFIFATEDGTIAAWAPTVDPVNAITMVDNSGSQAVYKGLAISGNGMTRLIYATNFRAGRVDVFDSTFKPVQTPGGFADANIPAGFAPFGIQAIDGNIYVTYAKQDAQRHDDVAGPGSGFINVFDPQGNLIRRVASGEMLNSPWGMTVSPASFGQFGGTLLVGNFGDGMINAFDLHTGLHLGTLTDIANNPLVFDGLWGLAFGNGVQSQPTTSLFFTAGPTGEQDGVFGVVTVPTATTMP